MCAKPKWRPPLNTVEFLLQGTPHELIDEPTFGATVSDREEYIGIARRWVGNPSLTEAERNRIQRVWLEGEWEHGMLDTLTADRRKEIKALIVPERVVPS